MHAIPSSEELVAILDGLISSALDRHKVSSWAMSIMEDHDTEAVDQKVWAVIVNLGAVDLPSTDRDYLYGNSDFVEWKKMLVDS